MNITDDRLYEFWCFCELTRVLLNQGRRDIVQRSLLRTASDKPVFAFGEDNLVYFEHRSQYFRVDSRRVFRLKKARPLRGPEWFILRDGTLKDSIVIDCKYRRKPDPGILDSTHWYCGDYEAHIGIVFCSYQPPRRRGRVLSPDSEVDRHILRYRPGDANITVFQVYLIPHPNYEELNVRILKELVRLLQL